MLIIPAIDIFNGKAVHLNKGDFTDVTVYSEDPVSQAIYCAKAGFKWIHIVDLSGAKDGKISTMEILREIRSRTNLHVQFGGGIRSVNDVKNLLSIGIEKIMIGSLPFVDRPEFEKIVKEYSNDKIIMAADTKRGEVVEQGWKKNSSLEVSRYINECREYGFNKFLITDIDKDGTLEGPNFRLYKSLKELFPDIFLYASGGIHLLDDLERLNQIGCDAVVVGKAIFENKISVDDLINFNV